MNTNKIVWASIATIITTLSLMIGLNTSTEILAEEKKNLNYESANGVSVQAEFKFGDGKHVTNAFQAYTQTAGYDHMTPRFELHGIVDASNAKLYEGADKQFLLSYAARDINPYGSFDAKIKLIQDEKVIREFKYGQCDIKNYAIETLYDKEEGWMGKGFAIIDKFTIECQGFKPYTPLMEVEKPITASEINEMEKASNPSVVKEQWQDNIKYKNFPK